MIMCPMVIGMPSQPPIGAVIRRARQRLRMSQDELALKVGASRSAVNAWERDRAWPRNIVALEEVLGISLDGMPEPELEPTNEWERATLANDDLPDETKRAFILAWRAERAAYKAQQAAEQETSLTDHPRAAG